MKDNRLELGHQLTQTQTLAPLQVQFVRLLEMNSAAIEDEVRHRLDENPALERVDAGDGTDSIGNTDSGDSNADDSYRDDEELPVTVSRRSGGSERDIRMVLEGAVGEESDMAARLRSQLDELDLSSPSDPEGTRTRALAEYIIGNLDDNGRLTRTLTDIADDITFATGHETDRSDLMPAFEAVRSLDPAGVGAIDLRDCMLLQLKRRQPTPAVSLATVIVDRYFDLLAGRRTDRIAARTGASGAEIDAALEVVRSLNPKPGNSEASSEISDRALHITPDFNVEPDMTDPTEKRFLISLREHIPELTVAEWHVAGDSDAEVFVRNRTREASEFISLLDRRRQTLMAIMTAIVDIQADFFRTEDPGLIKPMILKEVAARTGRDISVVSRATSGKYVATPGGVYPLKMFFNEAPTAAADLSQHNILETVRAMIEAEDKANPLSDDAITEQLQARGMDIARRTVAKYREQLGIANSRGRRVITVTGRRRKAK